VATPREPTAALMPRQIEADELAGMLTVAAEMDRNV
jgi:hypothetical protein